MIKISRRGLNRLIESFLILESFEKDIKKLSNELNQYMGKIEDKDKDPGGELNDLYRKMAAVVGGVERDFDQNRGTKEGDSELIKKMYNLSATAQRQKENSTRKIKRKYGELLEKIAILSNNIHQSYVMFSPNAFRAEDAKKAAEEDKLKKQSQEKDRYDKSFEDNIDMSKYTEETGKDAEIHMINFKAHVNKMIEAYSKSKVAKSLKLVELLKNCLKAANNAESLNGRRDKEAQDESILEFYTQINDIRTHLKTMQTNNDSREMASVFIRLANSAYNHLKSLPLSEKDKSPVEKKSGKKYVFNVGPLKMPSNQKEKINYAQELLYIGLQEDGDPPKDGKWSTAQPLWEKFCDKFNIRTDAKKNWQKYAEETEQKQGLTGIIEFIHLILKGDLILKGGEPA